MKNQMKVFINDSLSKNKPPQFENSNNSKLTSIRIKLNDNSNNLDGFLYQQNSIFLQKTIEKPKLNPCLQTSKQQIKNRDFYELRQNSSVKRSFIDNVNNLRSSCQDSNKNSFLNYKSNQTKNNNQCFSVKDGGNSFLAKYENKFNDSFFTTKKDQSLNNTQVINQDIQVETKTSKAISNYDQNNKKQVYSFQKLQSQQKLLKQASIHFQKDIYYIGQMTQLYKKLDMNQEQIFLKNHFLITIQSLMYASVIQTPSLIKKIDLPIQTIKKKTLVLDLDETLIHCLLQNEESQVTIDCETLNGDPFQAGINIRPYCQQFLEEMYQIYEIIIFTASSPGYANPVLDYLDPYISWRIFRDNCHLTQEGYYIKDLRILQNRDLKDIIIVDNLAYSFGFQIDNGIPIISYYNNENDKELLDLSNYLKQIVEFEDLRQPNKFFLKLNEYKFYEKPDEILKSCFQDIL